MWLKFVKNHGPEIFKNTPEIFVENKDSLKKNGKLALTSVENKNKTIETNFVQVKFAKLIKLQLVILRPQKI